MKPVMQTIFKPPLGNCFSACVASILELQIEEVPSFCEHPLWQDKVNAWLAKRGLWYLDLDWEDGATKVAFSTGIMQDALCILSGPSPRGEYHHSVVGKMECDKGQIRLLFEHDPYPGGGSLKECKHVGFIIPKEEEMRHFKISTQRNAPLIDVGIENNRITSIPVINELFALCLSKKGDDRNLIIANFHFLGRLEELFSVQNMLKKRIDFVRHHMGLVADSWELKLEEF